MKPESQDKVQIEKLRKIERQAKSLIYKMKHLEKDWEKVRSQLKSAKLSFPKTLGDVISRWNKT